MRIVRYQQLLNSTHLVIDKLPQLAGAVILSGGGATAQ